MEDRLHPPESALVSRGQELFPEGLGTHAEAAAAVAAQAGVELPGRGARPMEVRTPIPALGTQGEALRELPSAGRHDDDADTHPRTQASLHHPRGGAAAPR